MALTLTAVTGAHSVVGNKRERVYDVTFDASYADGGEALTPADVGLKVIEQAIPHGPFTDSLGDNAVLARYSISGQKLLAIWGNAGVASALPEVTATTDLSAYSGRMSFKGY